MKHIVSLPSDHLHTLVAFDVIGADGDEEDDLRTEVKGWLKANCKGRWQFRQHIGPLKPCEDPNGKIVEAHEVTFSVAFEVEKEAVLFKLHWC